MSCIIFYFAVRHFGQLTILELSVTYFVLVDISGTSLVLMVT